MLPTELVAPTMANRPSASLVFSSRASLSAVLVPTPGVKLNTRVFPETIALTKS